MSWREQNCDGSDSERCCKWDIAIVINGMFESLDSNSPRERGAKESLGSEHPRKTAEKNTSQSTNRKNMDEEWNAYARAGTAIYIIVQREETRDIEEGKVIVGSAKPFYEQRVEDMVEKAKENAELRETRQVETEICLHGFYYRRFLVVAR